MRKGNDEASSASPDELEVIAHTAMAATLTPPLPVTADVAQRPCYEQGLLRLVDDLDTLLAVWEREPLVTTGVGSFADIISTAAVQRLLRGGLPISAVRLLDHGVELPVDKL